LWSLTTIRLQPDNHFYPADATGLVSVGPIHQTGVMSLKTFEEVATLYNTYMDESEAYVDQVIATKFVMTPPSFEEMEKIIDQNGGMRESGMKPFRDRARTLIRHHYSNYDVLLRNLPTPVCENRFKYLVQKTIMAFANEKSRESRL
jgi:hypothetical protein